MTNRRKANTFGVVALALFWVSAPTFAVGQDPGHGTTFGMSVVEVQKQFPTAQPVNDPVASEPSWSRHLKADDVLIDGFPQMITFDFTDKGLVNVVSLIGGNRSPNTLTSEDVQKILEDFRSKYGQPIRCKGPDSKLYLDCFWHVDGSFIGFMGRTAQNPTVMTFTHLWLETDGDLLR